jgi:hypothetical protein
MVLLSCSVNIFAVGAGMRLAEGCPMALSGKGQVRKSSWRSAFGRGRNEKNGLAQNQLTP